MLEKKTPRQMNEISAERSHCSARARHLCHKLGLNGESPEQLLHLRVALDKLLYAERCREVANAGLSGQGGRVRSSDHSHKIAAGEPSIQATGGHVSGPCAGRRARERSIAEKDRENEPDMTTYPVEFHRRSEQKWALRALTATARESNESVIASAGSAGRADPTLAKLPEPNAVAAGNRPMAT